MEGRNKMNETFVVESETGSVLSRDSLNFGGSTRSLLTPLYASDYESHFSLTSLSGSSEYEANEESFSDELYINKRYTNAIDHGPDRKPSKVSRGEDHRIRHYSQKNIKQQQIFTKSWEEWLIEKAVEDLKKIELKREEKQKERIAKLKKREEKEAIHEKTGENRLKWLAQKNFEYEKMKKEKAAQQEYEKLKKQQRDEIISSKAKKAYSDWSEKKTIEQKEQKEKDRKQMIEIHQKKIQQMKLNEISFRKWKQKAKLKQKQNRKTDNDYGIFDYYDKAAGPKPSYVNPVPWKSLIDSKNHEMNFVRYKSESCFQSPPLLWKEHEERLKKRNFEKKYAKKQVSKGHSKY